MRQQLKVIQLVEESHYVPVKDLQIGGIVMVKHVHEDKEEELVEPVAGKHMYKLNSCISFKSNKFYVEVKRLLLIY